jgi:4-diphosphocytidyl-2-C-methyl-D-erythritol kinase
MALEKPSPCKVNLLLNILGKRDDGFHELETLMHPVKLFDRLNLARAVKGVQLTCSDPRLPTDSRNLVHRTATLFLQAAKIPDGVRLHLDKQIPLEAGLGGGSGNAATALIGLNELFGHPLSVEHLHMIAAFLGSDIPFFLQSQPALATGRGELIRPLAPFPALRGTAFLLAHPGFGISTAWAYQQLARFPQALNGEPGRAQQLVSLLQAADFRDSGITLYNSFEPPALQKYPLLAMYQEFLRANGALATLMSGSGSTTFALVENQAAGEALAEKFKGRFGTAVWVTVVPV